METRNINTLDYRLKTITKNDLTKLIDQYYGKKISHKLFKHASSTKQIERYTKEVLKNFKPHDNLPPRVSYDLIGFLINRFHKKLNDKNNYRNNRSKRTNAFYTALTYLLSDDPRVLALVQSYASDYTSDGVLICDAKGKLFVSDMHYVFTYVEILNAIRKTNGIKQHTFINFKLSTNDLNKLKEFPEVIKLLADIEKEKAKIYASFKNTENLLGDPITQFELDQLFRTDDDYAMTIDDILGILKAQNSFYVPYNTRPFSENEIARVKAFPAIKHHLEMEERKAKVLKKETIDQLDELVKGLMNHAEASEHGNNLPIAQRAFEKFNDFYQNLDAEEKRKLDSKWISSGKSMTFGDFYPKMHESCIHGGGAQVRVMVEQLRKENADLLVGAKDSNGRNASRNLRQHGLLNVNQRQQIGPRNNVQSIISSIGLSGLKL